MSESWGGARTPSAPAPVSGPGALSARTDGGVMSASDPAYGEGVTLENLRAGAPTAGSRGAPMTAAPAANPLESIVGLGAASQQPGTPVTAGAAAGSGPGLEALGLPQTPVEETRADARVLAPAMQALIAATTRSDATPSFRRLVRQALYT